MSGVIGSQGSAALGLMHFMLSYLYTGRYNQIVAWQHFLDRWTTNDIIKAGSLEGVVMTLEPRHEFQK